MIHQRKYDTRAIRPVPPETTVELATRVCRRLGLDTGDSRFFTTVFEFVREEELAGRDTYPLWQQYRRDEHADLATSAYLEAVASTRKMARAAL